jgi:Cdc6-like AAA superfamily ATPase
MASSVLPGRSNPFVHARALAPEESMQRPENERLIALAAGGHNAALHAPRRFGKTTLLKQVLQSAIERDMPGVLIDLSDVLSIADVAVRLEQAYQALPNKVRRLIGKELASVGFTTPLGGISLARRSPPPESITQVHTLLELPAQIAERHGQRVLVVLDEFQALVSLQGMDGVFRSHIQHHQDVSYIFAGSEPSMLRALFEDRARPLYGQAERIQLGRLESDDSYEFITRLFEESAKDCSPQTTSELVLITEGHPQRLMLVGHMLWERVQPHATATMSDLRAAYDATMRAVGPEIRYLWDALSTNERRVLSILASGLSPYQQNARLYTELVSSSSVARSLEGLESKSVIEREEDREQLRIVDPLVGRWVRQNGGARVQIHVFPHKQAYAVTDGPSLAFIRASSPTLVEAEAEADRIAARSAGSEVMIYDSTDPNDLPDWALLEG